MTDAVLGVLYSEGRRRKVWVLVEESVVRVLLLADKIDPRLRGLGVDLGLDRFEILQINEATIAMVWGEEKVRQKIGANDGLLDISDDERKRKNFVT